MDGWQWLVAGASLVGVVMNIAQKRAGFGIWILTNGVWMWTCFDAGLDAQAALHAVYAGLAVVGLVRWAPASTSVPSRGAVCAAPHAADRE